ncbi:MAG: phage major capsid protein [Eggerthellaceae bacterium]|nr:phage major capsid protein [Eggerthellaceae bacterium]
MTAIDINRGTTNVALPTEVSSEIWGNILEESAFMQLARRINMPGNGVTVQTITGEPTANWVDETAAKPVSRHTFGKKAITPYKLAVIEPFSNEFARDADALYAELVRRLPYALAAKFDATIMGTTAPGTGFDVLGGATKVSLNPASGKTLYDQFIAVDSAISAANGVMNGIALSPVGKSKVLAAVDGQSRPLFTAGVGSNTVGDILGAPVKVAKAIHVAGAAGSPGTAAIEGIAGDFSDAVYGTVEGVKLAISDQATLADGDSTINLWQNNMFAVRAEIEVAFAVKSTSEFVLLTGDTPSA